MSDIWSLAHRRRQARRRQFNKAWKLMTRPKAVVGVAMLWVVAGLSLAYVNPNLFISRAQQELVIRQQEIIRTYLNAIKTDNPNLYPTKEQLVSIEGKPYSARIEGLAANGVQQGCKRAVVEVTVWPGTADQQPRIPVMKRKVCPDPMASHS